MTKRILILSATSGNGHVRAGDALRKAFLEKYPGAEVQHIDALQYASPLLRSLYAKTYIRMVNQAPTLLGWIYDETDQPWRAERGRIAFDRVNTFPLARFITNYNPDLIVCTHFLPASIVSWLKARQRISTPHAVVVTDFDAHAMWLCRRVDYYFCAMEETRQLLIKLGAREDRVHVTGIPIDPAFALQKNKREARKRLGLAEDKCTIMLSAGGFGVGPMQDILNGLAEMQHPAQVLAMCGKNQKLRNQIEDFANSLTHYSHIDVIPVGYTDAMDDYMSASDFLVGKPGGLTTSEALAKGLLMVIVNPIPGQEERNADHLLEEGAAIRCNNLPALSYKIDRLLDSPARMEAMRANVTLLSRPRAAEHIAEILSFPLTTWQHSPSVQTSERSSVARGSRRGRKYVSASYTI
jgi:processive 1,2-diacylglycerol beta-glucosyltransferase